MIDVSEMPDLEFDTLGEASAAIRSWLQKIDERAVFNLVVQIGPNYVWLDFYREGVAYETERMQRSRSDSSAVPLKEADDA